MIFPTVHKLHLMSLMHPFFGLARRLECVVLELVELRVSFNYLKLIPHESYFRKSMENVRHRNEPVLLT